MADGSIQLRIYGMTCGACVGRVEKALRGAAGVRDASVNLMTESATLRVDTDTRTDTVVQAVRDAGYDAELMPGGKATSDGDPQRRELLRRQRQALLQAIGLGLPIILLDHFGPHLQGHHEAGALGWRLLQTALMVMLLLSPAAGPILVGGLRAARHRAPNMDLLITCGVLAAFIGSVIGTLTIKPELIHFHAAAMVVLLVNVGRYLEAYARGRAMSAMHALARRAAATARVRRDDQFVELAVDAVAVGDLVQVVPHAAVPVDAQIVEGRVSVDESLMTGEPLPVTRDVGQVLKAGTLIVEGVATARATQVGTASTLGRIVELVRQAQASRTDMQRLADRVAAVFTPIVMALSLLTFAAWMIWGGASRGADGFGAAIAVLVVACPCAMGLATPTAVLVATGQAALRGILVRDAASLEALGRVNIVVWDKTGTLTSGRPTVVAVEASDGDESKLMRQAAAAEQFSPHPLGKAIVDEARRRGLSLPEPESFESITGRGVVAVVEGRRVAVGSAAFVGETSEVRDQRSAVGGVYVAVNGEFVGRIMLEDTLRPSAAEAVGRLTVLGIESRLLSGDSEEMTARVAGELGIASYRGAASPRDKVEYVKAVSGQLLAVNREVSGSQRPAPIVQKSEIGNRKSQMDSNTPSPALRADARHRVAMVGDGVNDAAALAAADVGVAFATGADVAVAAAGVNLVGSTPHLVADAVELARRSVRIIRQNLFWAFFYNVLMLPLAAMGRLPAEWAAGAMMLSSLTVVLNALRLRLPHRAVVRPTII